MTNRRKWIWWVVIGGPILVFAVWAIAMNERLFFVKYLGMTPMEAIVSATKYGGQIMMQGHELGEIKEGYLADLLLVDGDPLSNLAVLREPSRMLAVMKDGVFYKTPEIRSARSRWTNTAA